ncbi:GNAT family N-acetyltransferase [Staphylococcus epidermidis]|uniref:GNAT family N-acetyltransferase n=1 Tax=Staphylococcus TaxID=1279 RepID=UPI00026BFDB1|nr:MULTISPECIES: GNAT family N-acetyltransferase [Staphylococcus]EJE13094.1 putative protease synthase and sporulation negative regulatory protein PAI 1 [Staphylococcus epidermidis NIHLM020]EJE38865.1 putative protease synthase and sporulation negative regulatory protein PAI 1 [Staphylococcus epidermidis NIH05003]KAA9228168.1 GNAT family N-acetyltransferase [Staphylococcus epidermidis]KAA9273710.1 GNAT family N-acetyltransferase [Staphylococcus epidermidis]MBF9301081.1 GNAT family N-acetyltran
MGERIRSVQITEVEQLQLIAKRTFFTTFRESYSDEDFKQFFSDAYDIDVLRKELEKSNSFHYFYEVDQNIVGFLKLNINDAQTENKGHAYLEIQRIYFDEAFQGSGRGQLFINLAIDQAIKFGKSKIWLGVWEHNPKALSFYKNRGFRVTGSHQFYTGSVVDNDLIMELDLTTNYKQSL